MSERSRRLNRTRWAGVRRAVFERDGYRCQAPGCGAASRLEAHHLDGAGDYEKELIIALCRGHHFEIHGKRDVPAGHDEWQAYVRRLQ